MPRSRRTMTRVERDADQRRRQLRRSLAQDISNARADAGISLRRVARAAGVRDHIQTAMLQALLAITHDRWQATPEVAVRAPVRGVIDLVLEEAPAIVAVEAQSDLRRLEQHVKWSKAKAEGLAQRRQRATSRLLLLRSTASTRASSGEYSEYMVAAYPARAQDAYAAITHAAPWPGDAVLWCRYEQRVAKVMAVPPRGVQVGRR